VYRYLRDKSKNKNEIIRLTILTVIVFIIVMAVMFFYTQFQNAQLVKQVEYNISRSTAEVTDNMDTSIGFALSSIKVAADDLSHSYNLEKDILENPNEIISVLIENTPFNSIEYVSPDGMNMTSTGDYFDASDREYYVEGIKGNSGIWINYSPKYSKETLVNFYTPVYYDDKIIGVITGTIGGNTIIDEMFLDSLYDQTFAGMVVSEDDRIIASTYPFELGMYLDENTMEVGSNDKASFVNALEKADGSVFIMSGKKADSIGCISTIDTTGWKVIQILPGKSVHQVLLDSNIATYIVIAIVLICTIALFVEIIKQRNKMFKMDVAEANRDRDDQIEILKSMADAYHSMHLININEDTFVEYSAKGGAAMAASLNQGASDSFKTIMKSTIVPEYLDYVLEFTNLETLPERMKGKKMTYTDVLGNIGWLRFSFIAIDEDEDERVTRVIFRSQIIDEEKKREQALIYKSTVDELTGLKNRRSFMEDIESIAEGEITDDLVIVSMDVNALKYANDNFGHSAGDDLLRGAAKCMKEAMDEYGTVYRVGGDEFSAILHSTENGMKEIKDNFNKIVSEWKHEKIESMAVSLGFSCGFESECESISRMIEIADERMYAEKTKFYEKTGIERRGQKI